MNSIVRGDSLKILEGMATDSVDLVFGSPPYQDARCVKDDPFPVYTSEVWVDWMMDYVKESVRVCRGVVAFVVAGRTRKFRWNAAPVLLMADLHREGFSLRDPCFYQRVGIPGSGGPDWFRHDVEFIVCASKGGRLPYADPTACGEPPKYGPGGPPSHRKTDGSRVDTRRDPSGERRTDVYKPPKIANPGNLIHCYGGGGHLGSDKAHGNEAPFPEALPERFVRSFCPPQGIVLDPFAGSGTTCAVAKKWGRQYLGIDIRQSQVDLAERRLSEIEWGESLHEDD